MDSFYFEGKCFHVPKEKFGWCDALNYCKNRNSRLLTVDNKSNYPIKMFSVLKYLNNDESFWVIKIN